MKPMLASDYNESKLKFPLIWQPKIDGVRALNIEGRFVGRSLRQFSNKFTTSQYSRPEFSGLDGELAANSETHPNLCRLTTSATGTIQGEPYTVWWLFDYVTQITQHMPYHERYAMLIARIRTLHEQHPWNLHHLQQVPSAVVNNIEELNAKHSWALDQGYEGSCIRDPNGKHKQGRSTVLEGGLLRIKDFEDAEAVVIEVKEGQQNNNPLTLNRLGKAERSTHAENMIPNGQVGTLVCRKEDGQVINVSPGNMDVATRQLFFVKQELIVGKTITYKHFPKGVKDKPRFPTFKNVRDSVDMSS